MKVTHSTRWFLLPRAHSLFNHCHASTLACLPDGELIAAFFAGLREGEGDVAIWLAHTLNGDWQSPVRLVAEERLPHWNPVLHVDGDSVWLFYKVGATVHDWTTRRVISRDRGASWSAPQALVPGDTLPRGPVRNKLLVMSNGDWIAPASIETEEFWDAFVDISADRGSSWHKYDVPIDHEACHDSVESEVWSGLGANALWETDVERVFKWDGVIQPTLWESAPGSIHMLMRSTRGRVYRSDSNDFGRSWNPAYATPLPNNNSGIDLARFDNGQLVLAFNPIGGNWGRRFPISLVYSTDNGESWEPLMDLETEEGEFSYPAVIVADGQLHLTYTWNRKNIVYWRIAVE